MNTLMTEIAPDMLVKDAMNDIERKKRERAAAQQAAEAKKVMVVMAAELRAASRELFVDSQALLSGAAAGPDARRPGKATAAFWREAVTDQHIGAKSNCGRVVSY